MIFLRLSALSTASAVLAGCVVTAPSGSTTSSDVQTEPSGDQMTDLSFWMWNTFAPPADEIMEMKLKEWAGENNVNIEISRDSDGNQQTKVMPALEAGTLPDALFVGSGPAIQMMEAGGLDPLNDQFNEVGEAHGGWQDRLEGYVNRDGTIAFLPYSIDTPMLYYRADILEEAGLTAPEGQWTWDETLELAAVAQQYTEDQGDKKIGWGFGVVKQQHDGWCHDLFRNMEADLWDESGEKIILKDENADKAVRALNFAKEAWEMGVFPEDAASWDWAANNKNYQEEQGLIIINAASVYVLASREQAGTE